MNIKASARSAGWGGGGGNLNSDEDSEARTVIQIFNDLMLPSALRAGCRGN